MPLALEPLELFSLGQRHEVQETYPPESGTAQPQPEDTQPDDKGLRAKQVSLVNNEHDGIAADV